MAERKAFLLRIDPGLWADLEAWAQAVGLDPCFVREVAIKTQYLSADACTPPIGQSRVLIGPFNNQQKHSDRSFNARLQ